MTDSSKTMLEKFNKDANYASLRGSSLLKKIIRFIKHPLRYLQFVFWRINVKIPILSPLNRKVKLFWGKEIRLNLDDVPAIGIKLFRTIPGEEEVFLTKYLIKNLKLSDIFYDIGANNGYYSYLAIELAAEVHVFEPLSDILEIVKNNFAKNNRVFINNVAVSDKKGQTTLYISGASTISTINQESLSANGWSGKIKITVPTITIDDYITSHNKPNFLKIDVEGAEKMVIDGGIKFFKESDPIIALEVWPEGKAGELSMKAVNTLVGLGYKCYRIDSNGDLNNLDNLNDKFNFENIILKK